MAVYCKEIVKIIIITFRGLKYAFLDLGIKVMMVNVLQFDVPSIAQVNKI